MVVWDFQAYRRCAALLVSISAVCLRLHQFEAKARPKERERNLIFHEIITMKLRRASVVFDREYSSTQATKILRILEPKILFLRLSVSPNK